MSRTIGWFEYEHYHSIPHLQYLSHPTIPQPSLTPLIYVLSFMKTNRFVWNIGYGVFLGPIRGIVLVYLLSAGYSSSLCAEGR